jgi:Rieske Fe-S protein
MGHHDDEQLNPPAGDSRQAAQDEQQPAAQSMEQYLRLHDHIERLRADRRPCDPGPLSVEDAGAYRMAALFRAATPGANDPDPVFVSRLLDKLRGEQAAIDNAPRAAAAPAASASAPPRGLSRRGLSRRGLLAGGLGAAAAAAVGIGGGIALDRSMAASQQSTTHVPLVQPGAGVWVSVAKTDAIPIGGVLRFTTDYIVGFVRHTPEGFSALSGVCTHMGCMLLWNPIPRTFDCPCHGGRFTEDGASAPSSAFAYRHLPTLQTRVEDGHVQVYVVPPTTTTTTPTIDAGTADPYGRQMGSDSTPTVPGR